MKNKKSDAKTDSEGYEVFACDLCRSAEAYELPYVREYTNGQVLNICKKCGFIYAPKRRSWKRIADAWSNELYGDPKVLSAQSYSAMNPHVRARLTYIAEFTNTYAGGMKGKKLCDMGAGEGEFLKMAQDKGAEVFGIEPSKKNCDLLTKRGFKNFLGAAEDYASHMKKTKDSYRADILTIMWTLEASQNPRQMLEISYDILKEGGYIVIGTGSRILVPFKKPLHCFLSINPVDTHPVHFSFNTLKGLLAETGFELVHANPFVENDILAVVAKKVDKDKKIEWKGDDYLKVANYFERWHKDSLRYR
jgi:2-polyprenyl-3-methyl-5-hydroxy-6-metoxy-1,4-benzoquinol methylase